MFNIGAKVTVMGLMYYARQIASGDPAARLVAGVILSFPGTNAEVISGALRQSVAGLEDNIRCYCSGLD